MQGCEGARAGNRAWVTARSRCSLGKHRLSSLPAPREVNCLGAPVMSHSRGKPWSPPWPPARLSRQQHRSPTMILTPEAMTLANRKVVMPPNTLREGQEQRVV